MSDSSDDENENQLREALDPELINDKMFQDTKTYSPQSENNQRKPSLRPNINIDDQFDMLNVTPQFQEYVAKKLVNVLDQKLNKRLITLNNNYPSSKRTKTGIKLFNNSTDYIKLQNPSINRSLKCSKQTTVDNDDKTKYKQIAINAEDILNKKDVKYWSMRRNAPIFRYQKDATGILTLID